MTTEFTPIASLAGGALIGLAAVMLMAFNGRIMGASGIAANLITRPDKETPWRAAFIAGVLLALPVWALVLGDAPAIAITDNTPLLVSGGLIVGVGTRMGSGCTSGHGVCGLSRLSVRSLAAVATFMLTAFATVFVMRHVAGG